jgi:ribonuclease-3
MANHSYKTLSETLGYTFNNPELIKQALTHRSAHVLHNERLEFIGDGVVNLVIGEALFHAHAHQPEGELSRWRAALVQRETLAEIGLEWGLENLIILGPGEKKTGGQNRPSNLANAVEAIIGAIYLDANFETVKQIILKTFQKRLSSPHIESLQKDPKTQLQEWLQSRQIPLPTYELIKTTGEEHASIFHMECRIPQLQKIALGQGSSKKRAEQDAASQMLKILNH